MTPSTTASNRPKLPEPDMVLDTGGLRCPMPVLRVQKQLRAMQAGQVLLLLSTDKVSWTEVPAFCEQAGHTLLHREESEANWQFWIRCR